MFEAFDTTNSNDDIDDSRNSGSRKQPLTPAVPPKFLKRSALPSLSTAEDERTKWALFEMSSILRRADCGQRLRETILAIYEGLPQGAEERCRSFHDLENDLGLKPGTMKNRSREAKEVRERIGLDLWTVYGAEKTGDGTNEDDFHDSWQSLRGLFAVRQEVAAVALKEGRKLGAFFEGATWDEAKWALDPAKRKAVWLTALNQVCEWKRRDRKEPKAPSKAKPDDYVAIAQGLMASLKRTCEKQGEKPAFHLRRIIDCAQKMILDCDDDEGESGEDAARCTQQEDPYADRVVHIGDQKNAEIPINPEHAGVKITPPPTQQAESETPPGVKKESLLKESLGEGVFTPPPETETVAAPVVVVAEDTSESRNHKEKELDEPSPSFPLRSSSSPPPSNHGPKWNPEFNSRNLNDRLRAMVAERGVNQWGNMSCPVHKEKIPSVHVDYKGDTVWLYCFACKKGGKALLDALDGGIVPTPVSVQNPSTDDGESSPITNQYIYRNADGSTRYRVFRTKAKTFPTNPWINGRWKKGKGCMKGIARILYRLPELLSADPAETVFVVEGEKAANLLAKHGFVVTAIGGANAWNPDTMIEPLQDRRVVVLADNDRAGDEVAFEIALSLSNVAVVQLPGLGHKEDVADWFAAGHTAEELRQLVSEID